MLKNKRKTENIEKEDRNAERKRKEKHIAHLWVLGSGLLLKTKGMCLTRSWTLKSELALIEGEVENRKKIRSSA